MYLKCQICQRVLPSSIYNPQESLRIPITVNRMQAGDIVPDIECPHCKGLILFYEEEPCLVCDTCGDIIGLMDIKKHILFHDPTLIKLEWKYIRNMFTGKWDNL